MPRAPMRQRFIMGGAAGLALLVVLALVLSANINRYKPRLEAAASKALGMDVRVRGRLRAGFFPAFHLTLEDARILNAQGAEVASARTTQLWIRWIPLIRRDLRLSRVELTQPVLSIERGPSAEPDSERLVKALSWLEALDGARVSLSNGTFVYSDSATGERIQASGLDLAVTRLQLMSSKNVPRLRDVSLHATLVCSEIRARRFPVTGLSVSIDAQRGIFELRPVTLRMFDGQATGELQADLSGPIPHYHLHCALPQFRVEEFLRTLSPKKAAEGAMDFSATLSMEGNTFGQMVRTMAGEVSLRGGNIDLEGHDLDRAISRFASSQSFNLVDVGAVFFAGPLGLAITKGYNFASLFEGSGGTSRIHRLVSDWSVERGVAQAKDVALATSENRIALQGGLDFVNQRFVDVAVAAIDANGCAKVRQAIRGSFGKPVVEKPRVLTSLAGPVVKLYRQTRSLFPARPCKTFYSGSVAAPR